jgi:hypothetical protein
METMTRNTPDTEELVSLWRANASEITASKWKAGITKLFELRKAELIEQEETQATEEQIND